MGEAQRGARGRKPRENARQRRGNGMFGAGGGGAHKPLLSQKCAHCTAPFSAVDPLARFCCGRCRTAHWKEERKRAGLIRILVALYDIGEAKRRVLVAAVNKAAAVFYRFAGWLGFTYSTKKYEWRLTA